MELLIKEDWMKIFHEILSPEDIVCVQCENDKPGFDFQMVLRCIQEIVENNGCMMVPLFTLQTLDPACRGIDADRWEASRRQITGFDKKQTITGCAESCMLFLSGVKRTRHPVYSFGYSGTLPEAMPVQNFPTVLPPGAKFIYLGTHPERSLAVDQDAFQKSIGTIVVQRAKIKWGKQIRFRSFVHFQLSNSDRMFCFKECDAQKLRKGLYFFK
ncbi:AAC(3) family N-acetyltransferase [Catenisphaera adipataccumulans]|uniref:Aminoglycoside N(3)-acetyltransferase n=1 Tax=Catenisphaera adipataccumulans TaxID=700500 RepID=A0A7W8FY82_9FIRM|nr:AAC(3) family N-acetyltransferase [Catenisphaera adipataccumulans]MBB5183742.1 aminoglycoside 3-N-acetyltransferase [Catenisphaera adipataccumulans]